VFPWRWQTDHGHGITRDDLVLDGTGKSSAKRVTGILTAPRSQDFPAALADRAASPLGFWPSSVFPLSTALTDACELVEPLPNVLDLELVEPLISKVRIDVQTGEQLIRLVCLGCEVRLDDLFQPIREKVAELGYVGTDRSAACLVPELKPCPPSGFVGLALDIFAVAFAARLGAPNITSVAGDPAIAVLDWID
jgi:hypothetical protein